MSRIVKVNYVVRDKIKHIYVFIGGRNISQDADLGPDGAKVFTKIEWDTVNKDSIPLTLIPAYLHGDDTIGTIKKKLIVNLKLRLSTKELYLFGIRNEVISPAVAYNQLTQEDTLDLTSERLCQYLLNIVKAGCDVVNLETDCDIPGEKKAVYDYEDFISIKGMDWKEPQGLTIPIGQKLVIKKNYPFTANPYNCMVVDPILKGEISNILTTQNTNLLFEYGSLCGNNIYLCLAQDVLEYSAEVPLVREVDIVNIYFPNLATKDSIQSLSELAAKKTILYAEQEKSIGSTFTKFNDRVDLFYDIFLGRKESLPYLANTPGITAIDFTIHPSASIKFPLEILFKIINSDEQIPLVKYNPGQRRENIYRLFTANNVATNGKRIPYLYTTNGNRKGKIIQISKAIARKRRVGFYIQLEIDDKIQPLVCEFEANGNIHVHLDTGHPIRVEDVDRIVSDAINEPILRKVHAFLEQSGYTYIMFEGLRSKNIEIKTVTYVSSVTVKKNIHLKNYLGCLSSVFNVFDGDLKAASDVISMRYKRVSNFNALDSEEAFINELRQQGTSSNDVIRELGLNFQLSEEEAKLKYASWISQIRTETDLFENKAVTIRTNTGFPVFIRRDGVNFRTTVTVESINNINYIDYLHIYIDSLLRLLTDKESTSVSKGAVSALCKGSAVSEVQDDEDIKAQVEKDVLQRKAAVIDANRVTFEHDRVEASEFLDLLADDDDDDDDIEFGEEIDDDAFGGEIGDDDIRFGGEIGDGGVEFGGVIEESPQAADAASRQLSPSSSTVSGLDVSPQSDVTSRAEVTYEGAHLKGQKNIFAAARLKRDPALFLKTGDQLYKSYSRSCPSQFARQPVVLTPKEKAYIDEQDGKFGTKSYDESVTYGSGSQQYSYICPRFWCLHDDKTDQPRSITFEEINEGGCGGWDALIPRGARKVPPGKRIYEFTDKRFHRQRPGTSTPDTSNILVYKPMFPGFQGKSAHPDKLCIPCCFQRPRTYGDGGNWEKAKDDNGKEYFYNKRTGEKTNEPPQVKLQYMYEPVGDGEGGVGPTFQRDSKGNVILSSIKGTQAVRELPADARLETFAECDQSSQAGIASKRRTPKVTKLDDAPLDELSFPIGQGQRGFLPRSVQIFLGYSKQQVLLRTQRRLKQDEFFLLRKGVEVSRTQSFLSCIADAYSGRDSRQSKRSVTASITIAELKKIILDKLSLDNFVTYQNGALVELFASSREVDAKSYHASVIYKSVNKDKKRSTAQLNSYFRDLVAAYEEFRAFISDDTVTINYEYLWDIICMPSTEDGGGLFRHGINLVILEDPNDDTSNKIDLICPTNYFSNERFNGDRQILILYSRNGYFEPIYAYKKVSKDDYMIEKFFRLQTIQDVAPEIAPTLQLIRNKIISDCAPLPSIRSAHNGLTFRRNVVLAEVQRELERGLIGYEVATQVVNFDTKAIGVVAKKTDDENDYIYIPCFPSAIDTTHDFVYADAVGAAVSYRDTVERLRYISKTSRSRIPSNPVIKVLDENVIVGVITETNQFVPTLPEPYQEPPLGWDKRADPDGLRVMVVNSAGKDLNYLTLDQDIILSRDEDEERKIVVQKIKLESNFYNAFRNVLRTVIVNYDLRRVRNELQNLIESPSVPYLEKLESLQPRLRTIISPYVDFVEYKLETLRDITGIIRCLGLQPDVCSDKHNCTFSRERKVCVLQIPRKNLINGANNSVQYFGRLADELIRYQQIRTFIFTPHTFLSFQQIPYNLTKEEIILLEELLSGDYFDNLVPVVPNKYVKSRATFDTASPSGSISYASSYRLDDVLEPAVVNICTVDKDTDKKLTLGRWKDKGLGNYYEIREFRSTVQCSWEIFLDIARDFGNPSITVNNLRNTLVSAYRSAEDKGYKDVLVEILKKQGKHDQSRQWERGTDIETILTVTNYYLTPLDLFFLSQYYKTPCILVCRTNIPTLFSTHVSFVEKGKPDFCYIILGGAWNTKKGNVPPSYGEVVREDSIRLSTAALGDTYSELTTVNINTLNEFVDRYYISVKLEKVKKRPKIKLASAAGVPGAGTTTPRVSKVKGKKVRIKL